MKETDKIGNFSNITIEDTNTQVIEELIIEMPKGYMNTEVSICNHFIADTNDSSNWDTIKFPLPKGKWSIKSVEGKVVTLIKTI